jgi:hypothetical protein
VARCVTSCHPTLQHHNSYNRTENHRQWNAVRLPNHERKDARNMLRNNWLPINHYLLHLVGLTFIYGLYLFKSSVLWYYGRKLSVPSWAI